MADVGAEFLFQVIAERAEKAAVILTTNLPFSEWTQVIPNARLVQGVDRPHYGPRTSSRPGMNLTGSAEQWNAARERSTKAKTHKPHQPRRAAEKRLFNETNDRCLKLR